MKKIFLSLVLASSLSLSTFASDTLNIPYKNLKKNAKITYNEELDSWSTKVNKHSPDVFVKNISDNNTSEYLYPDETLAFSTNCNYEFLNGKDLIGYSNSDLKFYDFAFLNGELTKRELTEEEIQALFPNFKIIKISEFSPKTSSLKIKKHNLSEKIIILNDTDKNFENYTFTSGNTKINIYELAGFIEIRKKGMIQFSHFGENTKSTPWFILLVR